MKCILRLVGGWVLVAVSAGCGEDPTGTGGRSCNGGDYLVPCVDPGFDLPPIPPFTISAEGVISRDGVALPAGAVSVDIVCMDCVSTGVINPLVFKFAPNRFRRIEQPSTDQGRYSIEVVEPYLMVQRGGPVRITDRFCALLHVHVTLISDGREAYVPWGGACYWGSGGGHSVVDHDLEGQHQAMSMGTPTHQGKEQ